MADCLGSWKLKRCFQSQSHHWSWSGKAQYYVNDICMCKNFVIDLSKNNLSIPQLYVNDSYKCNECVVTQTCFFFLHSVSMTRVLMKYENIAVWQSFFLIHTWVSGIPALWLRFLVNEWAKWSFHSNCSEYTVLVFEFAYFARSFILYFLCHQFFSMKIPNI